MRVEHCNDHDLRVGPGARRWPLGQKARRKRAFGTAGFTAACGARIFKAGEPVQSQVAHEYMYQNMMECLCGECIGGPGSKIVPRSQTLLEKDAPVVSHGRGEPIHDLANLQMLQPTIERASRWGCQLGFKIATVESTRVLCNVLA